MSASEPKSPYFSQRVHIGELDKKNFMGVKTRSIEITLGNQEAIIIRDKEDIMKEIKSSTIADKVWDLWEEITQKGHAKGHKFIEDCPK